MFKFIKNLFCKENRFPSYSKAQWGIADIPKPKIERMTPQEVETVARQARLCRKLEKREEGYREIISSIEMHAKMGHRVSVRLLHSSRWYELEDCILIRDRLIKEGWNVSLSVKQDCTVWSYGVKIDGPGYEFTTTFFKEEVKEDEEL
jgi:hypothetical protein